MHRAVFAAAAALLLGSAARADEPWLRQANFDRPGGAYISLPASDDASCAVQCAKDGLCLAWSFRAGACALKAVVTPARSAPGVTSGLAARAQHFASLVGAETPAPAAPPPPARKPAQPSAALGAYNLLGGPDDAL